jgi:hypothetical protein
MSYIVTCTSIYRVRACVFPVKNFFKKQTQKYDRKRIKSKQIIKNGRRRTESNISPPQSTLLYLTLISVRRENKCCTHSIGRDRKCVRCTHTVVHIFIYFLNKRIGGKTKKDKRKKTEKSFEGGHPILWVGPAGWRMGPAVLYLKYLSLSLLHEKNWRENTHAVENARFFFSREHLLCFPFYFILFYFCGRRRAAGVSVCVWVYSFWFPREEPDCLAAPSGLGRFCVRSGVAPGFSLPPPRKEKHERTNETTTTDGHKYKR